MLQTLFYAFLSILTLFTLTTEAAEGIYSNPDIHEERIVFQSGGKVWLGTLNEGKYIAYPLHNYGGISKYPKFSKDGKKIAFISNFETGSTYEIYLTDVDGNSLERLTYEALGSEDEIFFSDGDEITFSCLTKQSHRESCLKKVDIRTKKVVEMGVYQGTQAVCIDKNSYLFVRFQKQKAIQKYRGGQLRQIYKTKETKAGLEIKKIPLFDEANCYSPTICQSQLYFLSDGSSKARIYKYTDRGLVDVWGQDGFSIQSLTSKGGKLVMASFGDIWIYEPKTSKAMKVQLELRGLPQRETSWFSIQNELDIALNFRNPNNYFSLHEVLAIEDSGERSALLVRGSIILNSKGSDGFVRVKPDGEGYYYDIAARNGNLFALYGDASGNWLHIFYENGEKGTHFLDKRTRNRLVVSYDGKFVLTTSAQQELFLFDVGQNKETLVDKNIPFLLGKEGVSFSFDNQWIAYSVQKRNLFFQLKLFSVEQGKSYSITATEVDGYNPVWHPQQAALYFLNRNERNIGLARSIDHSNLVSTAKTILAAVSFNGQNPFSMDEVKELIPLKGDLFTRKVYKNPMTNTPGILFGTKNGMVILGKSTSFIPFKNGNEVLVKQSFDDLFFSATSDKGIVLDGKEFFWADISNGLSCIQLKPVEVTNQKIDHDSQGERKHFFYSILRNYQSYFFDQNIKDSFWDDLKNRYELLLERARNRVDFASLISMMLAELNTLHIFVEPYEPSNASFESQSLPLDVEYSEEKGGFEILRQYEVDPLVDDNNLLDPYKDFTPGSCIVAINNLPVQKDKSFEAHLEGAYGANVSFALKDLEGKVESQLVMPLTLSNCKDLGLYDWSYKNRLKVDEESKGQIGYIHLPSMDLCDYFVFTKLFSALSDKRGIILDLRYNYGGWIHNHVMDKIGKPNGVYNKLHGVDSCFEPADCHPKIVILCNQLTHSDGELVISLLKKTHDVTVIGMKTWGGGVGICSHASKVPGWLLVTLPAHATYDSQTDKVLVEQEGAGPIDIYVDIDPRESYLKKDLQLAKAMEILIDSR